jgi:hypothetical protein
MEKELWFYRKGYRITDSGICINPSGIEIKGVISNEYIRINARYKKTFTYCNIHRLQAFQKYGNKIYEKEIEVRHFDGNKLNNSFDNIFIGTRSQNMMDIPESIRISKSLHATSFIRKYDKKEIRLFYCECKSYKKTMDHFNISSKGTLHFILNSK